MSRRALLSRTAGWTRDQIHRLGVDVVRYPVHTTLAGHLVTLIGHHRVSVVIDVGANEGQFARQLRDTVGYDGRIVSFEPGSEAFRALTEQADADRSWSARRLALGSEEGLKTLHLFEWSDWNSLHEPDVDHLREAGRSLSATGSESVEVHRLDALWSEVVRPGDAVLLKSDTQGHDAEVIAGAGAALSTVAVIVLEGSLTTFYEGEPRLSELLELMGAEGFSPSGFFPVTRRRGSLALDTVDVCFVRTT